MLGQTVQLVAECPNLKGEVTFQVFEKTLLLGEKDKPLTLINKKGEEKTRIETKVNEGFAVAEVKLQHCKEDADNEDWKGLLKPKQIEGLPKKAQLFLKVEATENVFVVKSNGEFLKESPFTFTLKKRAPWMKYTLEEYDKYKGIKEKDTPLKERIENDYHPSTTLGKQHFGKPTQWNNKVSWCASFVNWCFEQLTKYKSTNISGKGSYNSLAFDWTPKNWENGEKCKPFYGAVIVLKYSHTAFIVGKNSKKNKYVYLGGNQGGKKFGDQEMRYGTVKIGSEKTIAKPKNYTPIAEEYILDEMSVNEDGSSATTR